VTGRFTNTITQDAALVVGQLYRLSVEVKTVTAGAPTLITETVFNGNIDYTNLDMRQPGTYTLDFIATVPVSGYYLGARGSSVDVTFGGATLTPLYVTEQATAVPTGFTGVVGALPGQPMVLSRHDDPKRQYAPGITGVKGNGWTSSPSYGGLHFAAYGGTTTGTQFYTLPLFAPTTSLVMVGIIRDSSADGGTCTAELNGQTVAFDAQGPNGEPIYLLFKVPAGTHTLKVTKLLRKSLYVSNVTIFATTQS
jgi:hypothetical protein